MAPAALAIISLAAVALAVFAALGARPFASLALSIVGALAVYWGALQLALPAFERIWLSQRMAAVTRSLAPCAPGPSGTVSAWTTRPPARCSRRGGTCRRK